MYSPTQKPHLRSDQYSCFLKLIGYGYTCPRGKVVYDCAQTGIVKGLKHLCNVFVCNAFTEHAPNLLHTLTSKQTMLKIITYTM